MNTVDLTKIKSVINDSFYTLLNDKNRYLVLKGGAGSGKSIFLAQKILLRILVGMSKKKRHRILVLRKTIPAARKSILPLFKHYMYEWGLNGVCKLNKTEMTFNFQDGSEIIISGLDDPDKIKSIFGITSIWLEEANEFSIDDFRQLDLRMRGQDADYYQLMLSFNPVSKKSWVYDCFFDKPIAGTTTHHSTYLDNRFLDGEYKAKLEALIDEDVNYYKVYTLGEWGSLEGIIYNNWTLCDAMPSGVVTGYGIDFGFNHPTTIVECGRVDKDIYFKEILYESEMTNSDLIFFIKNRMDMRKLYICDNAEPDRIAEMVKAGIRARAARKGKHSVLDGIDFLKRHTINIVKDSPNLINEISGYRWKEKRDIGMIDEPVKIDDHALDAGRYYIWTAYGRKETQLKVYWI